MTDLCESVWRTVTATASLALFRFLLGAPYEWFFVLTLVSFVTTIVAAVREHECQMNLLAFDLLRASLATHGLWLVATFAVLWNRPLMLSSLSGNESGPSRLTFFYLAAIGLGWFLFAVFRIQANRGSHPWQRPSIEESAMAAAHH